MSSSSNVVATAKPYAFIENLLNCDQLYAQFLHNAYNKCISQNPLVESVPALDWTADFKCPLSSAILKKYPSQKHSMPKMVEVTYNRLYEDASIDFVTFDNHQLRVDFNKIKDLIVPQLTESDVTLTINTGYVFNVNNKLVMCLYDESPRDGVYVMPNVIDGVDKGPMFLRLLLRKGTELPADLTLQATLFSTGSPKITSTGSTPINGKHINSLDTSIYNFNAPGTFSNKVIAFLRRQAFDDKIFHLTTENLADFAVNDKYKSMCMIVPNKRYSFEFRKTDKFTRSSSKVGVNSNMYRFCGGKDLKKSFVKLRTKLTKLTYIKQISNNDDRLFNILVYFNSQIVPNDPLYKRCAEYTGIISLEALRDEFTAGAITKSVPLTTSVLDTVNTLKQLTGTKKLYSNLGFISDIIAQCNDDTEDSVDGSNGANSTATNGNNLINAETGEPIQVTIKVEPTNTDDDDDGAPSAKRAKTE